MGSTAGPSVEPSAASLNAPASAPPPVATADLASADDLEARSRDLDAQIAEELGEDLGPMEGEARDIADVDAEFEALLG